MFGDGLIVFYCDVIRSVFQIDSMKNLVSNSVKNIIVIRLIVNFYPELWAKTLTTSEDIYHCLWCGGCNVEKFLKLLRDVSH